LKTSFEKIRRQDLLEAAFLTFLDHGLNGMTMARIGERAGMSHGIVNYYFKNKAALLNAVMRKANAMIMRDVAKRLRTAATPRQRLSAVVAGNFPPTLFTRNVARAWVSFYAAVATQADFEALQNIVYRRQRSNLIDALRPLTGVAVGEQIALGISVWIDGLWLRQAMERTAMTSEAAIDAIENYIDNALAEA
jgi:TetR/AcrR family transcriptional repressor of bet genes